MMHVSFLPILPTKASRSERNEGGVPPCPRVAGGRDAEVVEVVVMPSGTLDVIFGKKGSEKLFDNLKCFRLPNWDGNVVGGGVVAGSGRVLVVIRFGLIGLKSSGISSLRDKLLINRLPPRAVKSI